jgi:hypothetical protein
MTAYWRSLLVILVAKGESIALDGTPVEPEVAAERLVKLLRNTRRTGGSGSRAREPLGVFVTVNLDLIGLRDREVLLSWSMFGGEGVAKRVHGDWLNDNLAYVLKATSDRDSTFQLIWIPLPRSSGPFRVQVHLRSTAHRWPARPATRSTERCPCPPVGAWPCLASQPQTAARTSDVSSLQGKWTGPAAIRVDLRSHPCLGLRGNWR